MPMEPGETRYAATGAVRERLEFVATGATIDLPNDGRPHVIELVGIDEQEPGIFLEPAGHLYVDFGHKASVRTTWGHSSPEREARIINLGRPGMRWLAYMGGGKVTPGRARFVPLNSAA